MLSKNLFLELLESRTVLNASTDFMANQHLLVDTASFDADTILVQFNPDAQVSGNIDLHGAKIVRSLELVEGLYEVEIPQGSTVEQTLAIFQADTRVNVAEANYNLMLEKIPNDPYYNTLYGMNNVGQTGGLLDADIDAPEGWDLGTGTGGTIVAVIDSGVDYTHPDLAANMWRNSGEIAGDGVDNDGNGYADDIYGYDFANNDSNPMDDNNHGTHVAGTIGAVGNNGVGVAGVNWKARIMALKFLDATGSGSTSAAISALNYAVRMGAKISNNSWGGGSYSSLLDQAITNARNAGHIFVVAAGNSASNNDLTASYPSNYTQDNVVAVAATDSRDALATFSSYGATKVDLAAPGVGIYSTLPGNKYGSMSGTSMATPHVTGALSVIWDQNPTLTYQQVIQKLYDGVDKITALTGKVATGGRLNLAKALANPVTPPVSTDLMGAKILSSEALGLSTGAITGFKVKFSESVQAATFTSADILISSPTGATLASTNLVAVANTNNTEFTFSIATASTSGAYTLKVGPNVLDLAGNQMNQDGDTINGEAVQDQLSSSFSLVPVQTLVMTNSVPVATKDLLTVTSTINITQDFYITDLNLAANITHTYDSDLVITLKSPTGQIATLSNRRGGSGDNFVSTWFDDEGTKAISAGLAPFTGTFRPETSLTVFDGKNAKGVWTLSIADKASGDLGKLTYWGLKFSGQPITSAATTSGPKHIKKMDLETPIANGNEQVAGSVQASLALSSLVEASPAGEFFQDSAPAADSRNNSQESLPSQDRAESVDQLFSSSVGVDFILATTGSGTSEVEEVLAEVISDAAFTIA